MESWRRWIVRRLKLTVSLRYGCAGTEIVWSSPIVDLGSCVNVCENANGISGLGRHRIVLECGDSIDIGDLDEGGEEG